MHAMRNRLFGLAVLGIFLLAGGARAAASEPAKSASEPQAGGLASLLGALGQVQIPSLEGLIQPERMGVLTDNECRIEDNQPHLLSDNQINVLSGWHLLSDITVTVQITAGDGDRKAAKPKKADRPRKSNKGDKPDKSAKPDKSPKRKAARPAKGT